MDEDSAKAKWRVELIISRFETRANTDEGG